MQKIFKNYKIGIYLIIMGLFTGIHFVTGNNSIYTGNVVAGSVNITTMPLSCESVNFKDSRSMYSVFSVFKK